MNNRPKEDAQEALTNWKFNIYHQCLSEIRDVVADAVLNMVEVATSEQEVLHRLQAWKDSILHKNKACKSYFAAMHTERGQQRQKKQEEKIHRWLLQQSLAFDREVHINYQCALGDDANQKFARIDFVIYRDQQTVFCLEVDERQHDDRMLDCNQSIIMGAPHIQHVVWIRYNPDVFSVDDERQTVKTVDRQQRLLDLLKNYQPQNPLEILYLYYDTLTIHGVPQLVIMNDPDFDPTFRTMCYLK